MTAPCHHGAVTELIWTHLTRDTVQQWADLTNLLAEVDGTEEFYDAEDLAEELDEHGFTPELDSWAVWADHRMVAYGQLRVGVERDREGRLRCQLGGGVHPDWRGRGIGRELMDRMEARATASSAERFPGVAAYWRADGGLEGASVRRLLAHRGYEVVRYFNLLGRPLSGDVPVVEADARLVSPEPDQEEAVRVAHNAAFADHWGSTPASPERWRDSWTARSNRFDVSTLAVDDEGRVLAYCVAGQWVPRELYVNLVGTVPDARGRGLAAAALARTIALAAATGEYDVVELDVDSDSPTGATRLYERLGFTLRKTWATMQRDAR